MRRPLLQRPLGVVVVVRRVALERQRRAGRPAAAWHVRVQRAQRVRNKVLLVLRLAVEQASEGICGRVCVCVSTRVGVRTEQGGGVLRLRSRGRRGYEPFKGLP